MLNEKSKGIEHEIEKLKKAVKSLENIIRTQERQHKYLVTANNQLKAQLIDLQSEVRGLRNVRRK